MICFSHVAIDLAQMSNVMAEMLDMLFRQVLASLQRWWSQ
jgi:hypothetical protein